MAARAEVPGPDAAMRAVVESVRAALAGIGGETEARYCVAVSGGLDSSVLLHVLAGLAPGRLRAVYVNHQLHADAAAWGLHCERLCRQLGVPFIVRTVTVATRAGEGLEAAARRERYRALGSCLQPGEWLLTAHHEDDQIETVVLNLLRGSGPAGLAGVPPRGALGGNRLLRPLLGLPRAALVAYAHAAGLDWIEDPSNRDPRLDRNFLRYQVLPLLGTRWPGLRSAITRSARLSSEAARMLEEVGAQDARRVTRAGRIIVDRLQTLSEPRQRNLLRWLCWRELGSVPGERRLREGLAQLLGAASDRNPVLAWPAGEVRRFRSMLFVQRPLGALPATVQTLPVRAGAVLALGPAGGRLRLKRSRTGGLSAARVGSALTVRFRRGGERLRPTADAHCRELKKLFQERGIVPWMRDRIPLLYCGDELVAVADLWLAAPFAAVDAEAALRVHWDDHPPLQ